MESRVGPPRHNILEEDIEDEMVLYDPEFERYVSLNRTAADVWRLSGGDLTLREVVQRLSAVYRVEAKAIEAEVSAIVERFREAGLLDSPADA